MSLTVGVNSWINIEDATAYFAARFGADEFWPASLTEPQKEAALITAYNQLVNCGLYTFPNTATDKMKYAQCEQALFLIIHSRDADRRKGLQVQGVEEADIVGEKYDLSFANKMPISPEASTFLKEDYETYSSPIQVGELDRDESEDVE